MLFQKVKSCLCGSKFESVFWFMDMCCICFLDEHTGGEMQLHIQCLVRIIKKGKVIASSDTVSYSHSEKENENFSRTLIEILGGKLAIISNIDIRQCGDMYIHLGDDIVIEVTVVSSREEDEQWRFVKVNSEEEHIVCYPNAAYEE